MPDLNALSHIAELRAMEQSTYEAMAMWRRRAQEAEAVIENIRQRCASARQVGRYLSEDEIVNLLPAVEGAHP